MLGYITEDLSTGGNYHIRKQNRIMNLISPRIKWKKPNILHIDLLIYLVFLHGTV